jgi:GT2 family glycosyltransferase
MKPLISVIVVHHNNVVYLKDLLPDLAKQDYPNYEVIVVDNGSTDNSIRYVSKNHPSVRIVKSKINLGFAAGNNIGVRASSGKYIVLLNNDTRVSHTYLNDFVKVFKINKNIGIAQSKIILTNDRGLDTCGGFWTSLSFLYYIGNYKDPNKKIYNTPFKIFAGKGASLLVKREVIDKIGLFDNDFWNYYEETDFCHRAWISGWETWYWPNAVCLHKMGGTSLTFKNDYVQFHNYKNKLCSYLKNLELFELAKVIPIFTVLSLMISLIWLIKLKPHHALALIKAIAWNIRNLKKTYTKRLAIQRNRKVSDSNIWKIVRKNPQIQYYWYLFNDNLRKYID